MALDFPSSPTNGQTYTSSGRTWTWNSSTSTWESTNNLTSSQVTTALGYTPYNSTNPSGYTTNIGTVTSVGGTGTVNGLTLSGTVTSSGNLTLGGTLSLTSGNVTTALGYTPARIDGTAFVGDITIANSTSSADVFNGGIEIREVNLVANAQTTYTYAPGITFHWSNAAAAQLYMGSNGQFYFGAQTDKATLRQVNVGALYSNGEVTAFSDERLKTNWRGVTNDFVEKLANLKAGIYERIDTGETQAGVGAQSLQAMLPEAVSKVSLVDGSDDILTVAYGNAALLASVELAKELVSLKKEVASLRAELAARSE